MPGFAIPTTKDPVMGSPQYTALVVINLDFVYNMLANADDTAGQEDVFTAGQKAWVIKMIAVLLHEIGHTVGIPHHSDSRKGSKLTMGVLDVTIRLSPLQSVEIPIDSPEAATLPDQAIDSLVITPGAGCKEGDPDPAYRQGVFAGCLATFIVRRGQQESGDVRCPMRYQFTGHYEPPGSRATYQWTDIVTDAPGAAAPGAAPQAAAPTLRGPGLARAIDPRAIPRAGPGDVHSWVVDAWGGELPRWTMEIPDLTGRIGKFCVGPAGTGENARLDSSNLAGNAGRSEGCQQLVIINDNAGK
jgi:hypothetical protein